MTTETGSERERRIQRYVVWMHHEIPASDGKWCRYEDVVALLQELSAAQEKIRGMVNAESMGLPTPPSE